MASYSFNGYVIADILILLIAIALLVILIIVLTRNSLPDTTCDTTADPGCAQAKITKLDNKVTWLYALEIAAVSLMILAGVLAFFRVRSWMM